MHSIKDITQNPDLFLENIKKRFINIDLKKILKLDENNRKLNELSNKLRPDTSQEAPELVRYKQLIKEGHEPILALQECWHEYGIEDFHRSLRNSSKWNTKGNNGWTFKKYTKLLIGYRNIIEKEEIKIPIIILARNPTENHELEWISKEFIAELKIED